MKLLKITPVFYVQSNSTQVLRLPSICAIMMWRPKNYKPKENGKEMRKPESRRWGISYCLSLNP